ncbi:PspC domain-containing protein [Mollicutes bacterium LVI A0039]|nr:PspC domain-containing protein [Mollicutes bacterium LVI A0039]
MNKLYRNAYDSVIAGVCSGLSDYLNIDKNVIRLIAAVGGIFLFPVFIITYILAWAILPIKNY